MVELPPIIQRNHNSQIISDNLQNAPLTPSLSNFSMMRRSSQRGSDGGGMSPVPV